MNKQEAIEKINKLKMAFATKLARSEKKSLSLTSGATVVELQDVIDIVNQIDEPEKVKLTKAQEDYLLGFGDIENKESEDRMAALYYIVRVGWGYLFTAAPSAGSDEIPLNSDYYKKLSGNLDIDDLKTLLIKALVNGYEVEKEKRYTARLKVVTIKKAGYLNRHNKNDSITIDTSYTAGGQYQVYFTRSELEELNVWDNPAFEIEEATNE